MIPELDAHEPILHRCTCGRSFTAHEWAELKLCGYQQAENPDELLELRQCHCHSSRAVTVPGPGFWLETAAQHTASARAEAHRELFALAQYYLERAAVCSRQAAELLRMLSEQQRITRGREAQAAE